MSRPAEKEAAAKAMERAYNQRRDALLKLNEEVYGPMLGMLQADTPNDMLRARVSIKKYLMRHPIYIFDSEREKKEFHIQGNFSWPTMLEMMDTLIALETEMATRKDEFLVASASAPAPAPASATQSHGDDYRESSGALAVVGHVANHAGAKRPRTSSSPAAAATTPKAPKLHLTAAPTHVTNVESEPGPEPSADAFAELADPATCATMVYTYMRRAPHGAAHNHLRSYLASAVASDGHESVSAAPDQIISLIEELYGRLRATSMASLMDALVKDGRAMAAARAEKTKRVRVEVQVTWNKEARAHLMSRARDSSFTFGFADGVWSDVDASTKLTPQQVGAVLMKKAVSQLDAMHALLVGGAEEAERLRAALQSALGIDGDARVDEDLTWLARIADMLMSDVKATGAMSFKSFEGCAAKFCVYASSDGATSTASHADVHWATWCAETNEVRMGKGVAAPPPPPPPNASTSTST